MTVKELITILSTLGQNAPIATGANGNEYFSECDKNSHGPLRVVEVKHYAGTYVLIGNPSKRNLNGGPAGKGNWYITRELDGGPKIKSVWWREDVVTCECGNYCESWYEGQEGPGRHAFCGWCEKLLY